MILQRPLRIRQLNHPEQLNEECKVSRDISGNLQLEELPYFDSLENFIAFLSNSGIEPLYGSVTLGHVDYKFNVKTHSWDEKS